MQSVSPTAVGSVLTLEGHRRLSTATSRLWYRALLSDALIGAQHVPVFSEYFSDALRAADWPEGACLVLSNSDTLYFSPASIAAVPHLIVVCGARPSPPPDRAGATLLVGGQCNWDLLPHNFH